MIVSELIEQLQMTPMDADLYTEGWNEDGPNLGEILSVTLAEAKTDPHVILIFNNDD